MLNVGGMRVSNSTVSTPIFLAAALCLGACSSAQSEPDESTAELTSGLNQSAPTCTQVNNADGWSTATIPAQTAADGPFVVQFTGSAFITTSPDQHDLDAVIGLSDGPADAFTDLGPIVRFYHGGINLRDGSDYVGTGAQYAVGHGPLIFKVFVDLAAHRYSAWSHNFDGAALKEYETLGMDLAFRTEQANMARIDNIGVRTDSTNSGLQAPCSFSLERCANSTDGVWSSKAIENQTGNFRFEFIATPSTGDIDAVVGLSNGAPDAFSDLAVIVRFGEDGYIDARNGGAYQRISSVPYVAGKHYYGNVSVNLGAHTFSVQIYDPSQPYAYVAGASNLAFRTEQAAVTSLDHAGQFVDGTPGAINVCSTLQWLP